MGDTEQVTFGDLRIMKFYANPRNIQRSSSNLYSAHVQQQIKCVAYAFATDLMRRCFVRD